MNRIYRLSLFMFVALMATFSNANNICSYDNGFSVSNPSPINQSQPAVASLSVSISGTTSICQKTTNSKITFTGSGGTAPYTFTYNLAGGSNLLVSSQPGKDTVTVAVNTNTPGVYNYILINVSDAASDSLSLNVKATVTVNSLPNITFKYTDNQCDGTGFVFTPSLTGAYSYAWDFGDGTSSTEVIPTHLFTDLGNVTKDYYVTLTITDNSTTCQNTVTKKITITQLADATLTGSGSGVVINGLSAFSICSNEVSSFTFKNTSTTASTNLHYRISWGDGTPDFDSTTWVTKDHTYPIGLWKLTYSVQGQGGCWSTRHYFIFDGSNPGVALVNPGNTNVCFKDSISFDITGTEKNPNGTTYTVSYNDGSPPEVYNHPAPKFVTHKFIKSSCGSSSSDGTNTYQNAFFAKIIASNICGQSASTVTPIYVSTPPTADFTLPLNNVCTNTQICFTNTSLNGNAIVGGLCSTNSTLTWLITPSTGYTLASGNLGNDLGKSDPSQWSSGTNIICPIFTKPGTYTITMKMGNRCNVDQIKKTICVEAPLIPLFSISGTQGCAPFNVTTTNKTDTSNTCIPSYKWTVKYAPNYCGTTSGYTFTSGTSASSFSPAFQFTNPGVYTIQLATTNSCGTLISSQSVTVTKPPEVSITPIPDFCSTASFNPVAKINTCAPLTGTTTYAWSFPGGIPASSTDLNPGTITYNTTGTYKVSLIVTNDCGASVIAIDTFTVKPTPTITNTILAQTICSGLKTDSVVFTSDMPAVTYSWKATATQGITGFIASGTSNTLPVSQILNSTNSPGVVIFYITPTLNGCVGVTVNYVVTVYAAPVITSQPLSIQVCQGGVSSPLSVAVDNGLGTPSYQWYRNTANNNTTGTALTDETKATYTPIVGNKVDTAYYYCEITFSAGSCKTLVTNTASVSVQPSPIINVQPVPFQAVCIGGTIPTPLSLSYTGGGGIISYQWFSNTTNTSSGGIPIAGATNSNYTPPVFTTTGTSYYYVEVKFSGSACGFILSDAAKISVVTYPIVLSQPEVLQTLCQNTPSDTLKVAASGGIGSFSYQWYSNSTNNTTTGTKIASATDSTFTPPTTIVGTTYYYCLITQPNGPGCTVTSNSSQVIVNASPTFSTQPASSTVCLGATPTLLNVSTQNGTGTPQYQWYSNSSNSIAGGSIITGATGLTYAPPAGTVGTVYYYCLATFSSGGCSSIISNIARVTINAIPAIKTILITTNSGDAFSITPNTLNGDTVPAGTTYTWTAPMISPMGVITGATSKLTPQTAISQTLTNTTTGIATATYTVTPTSGTCRGADFNLIVTVNPPLNPNATLTGITCFGAQNGIIQTAIQGGLPFKKGNPYIITWTGPNGFTAASATILNLLPGDYFLIIKDSAGITIKNKYTITEPGEITVKTNFTNNVSCFGSSNGEISLTVTGGTLPYKYLWIKDAAPFTGTDDIKNLSQGNYNVTITDKNNCSPKTVSFVIQQPTAIIITLKKLVNVICYGDKTGAISVDVTGGTPVQSIPGVSVYTYAWTGPNGFTSSSQNLTNVAAGDYQLTVIDKTGCTQTFKAKINQQEQLKINAVTTPITCYGANNASIQITVNGGIPPYQIQWSNMGKGFFQDNLSPGTYTVQIVDSAGCTASKDIVIAEAIFFIQPVVKQISCNGAHDGSIILNLKGGVPPISLVWLDKPTAGTTRNQLGPGTYTVTINDKSSCTIHKTFTIIEPRKIRVTAVVTHAMECDNPNSGAIKLSVSGGTTPYSYTWSNGKSTKDLTAIQGGSYGLTVTDSSGCTVDTIFEVIRPLPMTLSVKTIPDFDCQAHTQKEISTAQITGGVPPFQYTWSYGTISGLNNEIMTTSQPGLVTLGVTDSRGCTASYTFSLNVPVPGIDYQMVNCDMHILAFKATIPNTADGLYTYLWNFGDSKTDTSQNPQHTYATPGTYNVMLTLTSPTCTSVFKKNITVDATPSLSLDKLPVFCTGDSLLVHVSGAATYRWGDGSAADSLLIKQPGDYSVTGTSNQGCTTTYSFKASNFELFKYTIQSDKNEITTQNPTLQFWSESITFSNYFWTFGDNTSAEGNTQNHTYNIVKDGYYDVKLKVINPNGCLEYATKRIWVTDISIGNVFSPAYDGVYLKGFHIQVYNRNGFLLYDGVEGWNGNYKDKPVSNDTYFYVLYLSGESGVKTKSGFVTVVR